MAENDNDKTDKLTAIKEKSHPLSSRDQKGPDHPQNGLVRRIKLGSGFFRYEKETKEYASDESGNEKLTKITREHQAGKTFWDWLQLLAVIAIPVVVTFVSISYSKQQDASNQQQHKIDLQIAQANRVNDLMIAGEQQREATLQTYLDDMSNLMLNNNNNNLLASKPGDEIRQVARVRTLTTLRRLDDGHYNQIVLQFLQDAHLIGIHDAYINLSNADMSNIDLSGANLSGTDLSGADLSGTNLSNATLIGTILNGAVLSGSTLKGAFLSDSFLIGANLNHADLSGAELSGVDLRYADMSNAILNNGSLNGAIMKGAILSNAFLKKAILIGAILIDANLSGADLSYTSLSFANLSGANLSGANLNGADMSDTYLNLVSTLTQQQLDEVNSCTNAILSTGLICHRHQ